MIHPRHGRRFRGGAVPSDELRAGRAAVIVGAARGFRAPALLVAGALAMGAGVGVGAAFLPDDAGPDALAVAVGGGGRAEPMEDDAAPAAPTPAAPTPADDVPRVLPVAVAAVPALIDGAVVDASGLTFVDREAGLLSADVPSSAGGELVVVAGNTPAPSPDRPVRTVRVEVESGLAVDGEIFAAMVMATLNDPRSWGGDGSVSFARTDGDDQDLRVVLASPDKVDAMCAPLNTHGDYSCGRYGHAAINYLRWVQATEEFPDRTVYRQYVINHEVGHLLGHQHTRCGGSGQLAPIMQQQSIRVAPCTPNAWPFPDAG